ncbi:hypothetical protein Tco_1065866 [Tanacetum coccineum]
MKHSIDDVNNTILHANKKPTLRSNPTPREQRHDRRDRARKKDRIIDQKQAKKREREEEVMRSEVESKLSNKLLKATHSPIQVEVAVAFGDVIGVGAAAFVSRKPKMRVMIPRVGFRVRIRRDEFLGVLDRFCDPEAFSIMERRGVSSHYTDNQAKEPAVLQPAAARVQPNAIQGQPETQNEPAGDLLALGRILNGLL